MRGRVDQLRGRDDEDTCCFVVRQLLRQQVVKGLAVSDPLQGELAMLPGILLGWWG